MGADAFWLHRLDDGFYGSSPVR